MTYIVSLHSTKHQHLCDTITWIITKFNHNDTTVQVFLNYSSLCHFWRQGYSSNSIQRWKMIWMTQSAVLSSANFISFRYYSACTKKNQCYALCCVSFILEIFWLYRLILRLIRYTTEIVLFQRRGKRITSLRGEKESYSSTLPIIINVLKNKNVFLKELKNK